MTHFPVSHKTLFVLDHSTYFAQSCKQPIEYDLLHRTKGPGIIPAAPITKPLWTCNVEGLQEYMRIVFDIYPTDKLIQVISGSTVMNEWTCKDPIPTVMAALAHLGRPKVSEDSEFSLSHGLAKALQSLRIPTAQQQAALDQDENVKNRGRIVCLTVLNDDSHIRKIQEFVQETIQGYNRDVQQDLLPIDRCELVLLHSVPIDAELHLRDRPPVEVSPHLTCEVCVTLSGRHLYNKLVSLCCTQFDLCSTTVTGIPMKEEQNASSSANYDVELLHPAAAHDELFKSEHAEGLVIKSKEGLLIDTAPLKWCTPKSSVVELHNCSAAYRICPVDVNSRPSSCLTNFLLSGRAVMLEQPRKCGNKVLSHMLAAHGGEIFIHSLPTCRSILEDPPSISEGPGGRVTDYRINAFREFLKENRLAPGTPAYMERLGLTKGSSKAVGHLERSTRYWPMIISDTILFNIDDDTVGSLGTILEKPSLTEPEVTECTKAILRITAMEAKNEALPAPPTGNRGKGPKREEQYRQLWAEVESLVRAFSDTSEEHAKVLECVLNCKKPGPPVEDLSTAGARRKKGASADSDSMDEVEQSWKDLEKMQQMSERERQEMIQGEKSFEGSSPPKKIKSEDLLMRSGGQTLLSMWNNRLNTIHSKRTADFDGRLDSEGPKAKLYMHLDDDFKSTIKPTITTSAGKPATSSPKPSLTAAQKLIQEKYKTQ